MGFRGRLLQALLPVSVVILLFVTFACGGYRKNKTHKDVPDENIERGKILAATYCKSCHLLPDPSMLDAKSWEEGVLPAMGPRLGIFYQGFRQYPSSRYDPNVDTSFYPSHPVLNPVEWQYILDYYTAVSPDSLEFPTGQSAPTPSTNIFQILSPPSRTSGPTTCFVGIDTANTTAPLLIADMNSRNLTRFDHRLQAIDSFKTSTPVVDVAMTGNAIALCNIGVFNPNNGKSGSLVQASPDTATIFTALQRPVQTIPVDLNSDGLLDYVVCEFGNLTGALSWLEQRPDHSYVRHIIRALPGAIKAYIRDANNDGKPDIWALFSQGDEGIFLFTNKGDGKFETKQVLQFPAVYGSSYFEFADFNGDHLEDILYACGDNADFSPVLKPYHGIYIFMNKGDGVFKQEYFYPMAGCFKAMAADFNKDGRLDIAAISFFADFSNHPERSFIYLQGEANLKFAPYTIPGTDQGRWLTMSVGDIDGDKHPEIVLGNFSIATASIKAASTWQKGPPFLVLKIK